MASFPRTSGDSTDLFATAPTAHFAITPTFTTNEFGNHSSNYREALHAELAGVEWVRGEHHYFGSGEGGVVLAALSALAFSQRAAVAARPFFDVLDLALPANAIPVGVPRGTTCPPLCGQTFGPVIRRAE